MALLNPFPLDASTYGFEWIRAMMSAMPVQAGVIAAGDFKVTAAAAGGQRVDVAAGNAFVNAAVLNGGLYLVNNDASIANAVTFDASDATNPRIDQVILRVRDLNDLGDTSNGATLEVLKGTATAGATLDNRTGAVATLTNAIRIADVLIPAASTAVSAANIRDRRPWSKGARRMISDTSGNVTNATTTLVSVATPVRIETAANILEIGYNFTSEASAETRSRIRATVDGGQHGQGDNNRFVSRAGVAHAFTFFTPALVTAGSHLSSLEFAADVANGTITVYRSGPIPVVRWVRELVIQDADNN